MAFVLGLVVLGLVLWRLARLRTVAAPLLPGPGRGGHTLITGPGIA